MATTLEAFVPALIVVDFQEDFCPPNGSLAVPSGRDIAPTVNNLLSLPGFAIRIATKDFHPRDHISFSSNHPGTQPFTSFATIENPYNPAETQTTRLWPDHCIQGTPGADLVPELDVARMDHVLEKGQDKRVEMYSAFGDPFRNPSVARTGLAAMLREKQVSHVFVVGLAMDYCVRWTAVDSAREGFETVVVREGTRAVDEPAWEQVEQELQKDGVKIVGMEGMEVRRVKEKGAAPL